MMPVESVPTSILAAPTRDLKDYPRAVSLFLKAADVAEQSRDADTLIWQNALSQLRNLYMLQLNYEEELNVALQSVALAKQSGKNLGCYPMDVASAYSDFHHYDKVDSLLKIGMKPGQFSQVMDAKIQTVWNRVKRAEEICGNMKSTQ